MSTGLDDGVAGRLRGAVEGEVLTARFDRGRYATDASNYQVWPRAVVVPRKMADVETVMAICREEGLAMTPRGGGTSQCGQTVNETVVLDLSRHLNGILDVDPEARTAVVQPGLVLDELNRALKPHGLWYPVDVSTASRATLGGMTANNSCGARSIRYGMSRDNVLAIDAILADGTKAHFGEIERLDGLSGPVAGLFRDMLALGRREAAEIARAFPKIPRRVGGYNIDALVGDGRPVNMATLLVGSEGTLAFSEKITLKLSPLPGAKVMGLCHFPDLGRALDATRHIVRLDPTAVELFDRNMLDLARGIDIFRPVIEEFVRGEPQAILMVEFAEPDMAENRRRLAALHDLMADLGFAWNDPGKEEGGVVEAIDPGLQGRIVEVRRQGLNIMMSMRDERKPIAFIEDACVPLESLADYAEALQASFARHGTSGTFYAHASVGTLHIRPILNLKLDADVKAMRAIAEEAFEAAVRFGGTPSGEHGDGIVRSEFQEMAFGPRMVRAFEEVKDRFDPRGLLNPGRVVRAPKMDDRRLLRYGPGYAVPDLDTVFRWPGHGGAGRGFQGAVEMCNNNGACRKLAAEVMCPSYRVTRAERDLTRGRANSLRLAISGQLGPGAFTSDEMAETMKLCVSCKACRRECPTGVDMAKMKIEVLAARAASRGHSLRDRLVGHLPRYAPWAARAPWLANLRNRIPALARLAEPLTGFAAARPLPEFSPRPFLPRPDPDALARADVVLFADCFNRWFEPENLRAAERVLAAAGLSVGHAGPVGGRPLCCGRTYLSAGMPGRARAEMERTLAVLRPVLERGTPVVGLEPSCLLTFRDEAPQLLDGWSEEQGRQVMLFEEYLDAALADGRAALRLDRREGRALLHGHCHQKSFGQMGPVQRLLGRVPGLAVEAILSSCCGMAGSFGYQAETQSESRAMAGLSLIPRVREAPADAIIVADGTSCRHQIADLAGRGAVHVARVLDDALEGEP